MLYVWSMKGTANFHFVVQPSVVQGQIIFFDSLIFRITLAVSFNRSHSLTQDSVSLHYNFLGLSDV